ncbi:MAG: Coenzyme F420 hydrogenase/dehydrogenase, beta subunit C-terminal domain [Promethearchaeia archaeon]
MNDESSIQEVLPKSFEDLIKEIHNNNLCGQCGGCVSFCSADEIRAIEMSPSGPPRYVNKDNCLHCGICYLVCPQTYVLNKELNAKYNYKIPIGNWIRIASSKATSDEIWQRATDGGVVTSILLYLLEKNLINGALVCKQKGPFNREPFFASSKEELIEAAGSHFDTSQQVVGLEKYNTFIPTISKLKRIMRPDLVNIAVVGTPCQIHSIRKMQELSIIPAHIVKYTLGLFCNFNFSFSEKERKDIEKKYQFSFEEIERMNIRENLIINLYNGKKIMMEFDELKNYARPACFGCFDFSNVYADISFGGLGSGEKYTTVIVRTEIGDTIYKGALKENYIEEPIEDNTSIKKSEMLAKVISFSKRKIERNKAIRQI